MVGTIGKKIGMTSVHYKEGFLPCTVVQVGASVVTQIKTKEKEGYDAVQIASIDRKEKNTKKPLIGHFKKAGIAPKASIMEFRDFQKDFKEKKIELGMSFSLSDLFEEGEFIDVHAKSKGKGTQGVVKRWGFRGVGDASHGQHNRERAPGSIGAGSTPSRVFKGLRMAGRMGNQQVTVANLQVLKILEKEGLIVLKGSIPGPNGGYVVLKK